MIISSIVAGMPGMIVRSATVLFCSVARSAAIFTFRPNAVAVFWAALRMATFCAGEKNAGVFNLTKPGESGIEVTRPSTITDGVVGGGIGMIREFTEMLLLFWILVIREVSL